MDNPETPAIYTRHRMKTNMNGQSRDTGNVHKTQDEDKQNTEN